MSEYNAPLDDMNFVINELADLDAVAALPAFAELEVGRDLSAAILEEAGKFVGGVLAPNREAADRAGAKLVDGKMQLPEAYPASLQQFFEQGWMSVSMPADFGGQGLPELLNTACSEMWNSGDMSFTLGPVLTAGAALAIHAHASDELKAIYLEKMIAGQWMGTMNLTEPQSGSDLATIKTKAVREGDHFRISGQKIFITWGDHEVTENVIHLVLARIEGAPEGTKGISLFVVPKYLVNADGSVGERNDAYAVGVEHKLGIHASPTCVMAFGDNEGAIGYLVGEENRGLMAMFTMMNEARLKVGLQGLGVGEGAYQHALWYARDRIQGRNAAGPVAIVEHADVRRMLMTMRALNEAMRAYAYVEAANMDVAHNHPDADVRASSKARMEMMIPVVKGWLTELGQEVASLGVQVHGGMGFIEEAGAAQFLRDVRIAAIYEGTNGIQAADLVGRKLGGDRGAAMNAVLAEMQACVDSLSADGDAVEALAKATLAKAVAGLQETSAALLQRLGENPNFAMLSSFDYMMQAGYAFGCWQMARAAKIAAQRVAADAGDQFAATKLQTVRFYMQRIMPRAEGLRAAIMAGDDALLEMDTARF